MPGPLVLYFELRLSFHRAGGGVDRSAGLSRIGNWSSVANRRAVLVRCSRAKYERRSGAVWFRRLRGFAARWSGIGVP